MHQPASLISALLVLSRLVIAGPLAQLQPNNPQSCNRVNDILSVLNDPVLNRAATAFCSSYIRVPLATVTNTVTSSLTPNPAKPTKVVDFTPDDVTSTVTTTTTPDPVTQFNSITVTPDAVTVTETSTVTPPAVVQLQTITETTTISTSTFIGVPKTTTVPSKRANAPMEERNVELKASLKEFGPKRLSRACSCLTIPQATVTATSTTTTTLDPVPVVTSTHTLDAKTVTKTITEAADPNTVSVPVSVTADAPIVTTTATRQLDPLTNTQTSTSTTTKTVFTSTTYGWAPSCAPENINSGPVSLRKGFEIDWVAGAINYGGTGFFPTYDSVSDCCTACWYSNCGLFSYNPDSKSCGIVTSYFNCPNPGGAVLRRSSRGSVGTTSCGISGVINPS